MKNNDSGAGQALVRVSFSEEQGPYGERQVGVITLDRPDKRNALRTAECLAIADGVRELVDAGVRAILLTGTGTVFCAGADLGGGVYADGFDHAVEAMLQAVLEAPVPVIADVHGPAIGAGCQLILACDLRVFQDAGECWVPVARHGFALDEWTHSRAVELMGGAWARNIFLGGAHLNAEQARELGFAIDPRGATAEKFAAKIAAQAPLSMQHSKATLNSLSDDGDTREGTRARLQELFAATWASEDAAEARAARREGRAPKFQGR